MNKKISVINKFTRQSINYKKWYKLTPKKQVLTSVKENMKYIKKNFEALINYPSHNPVPNTIILA